MRELVDRLERLSSQKRRLLARRNPLSFAQERLWFLDRLHGGSSFYNGALAIDFDEGLDLPVLAGSLVEIVRRHQVLRTAYLEIDGLPMPVPVPAGPLPLPLIDLSGLGEERRPEVLADVTRAEVGRPFDLEAAPVVRPLAVRQSARRYTLLLTIHHIAADRWSLLVLVRELAALYEACAAGRPSPLAELPLQYADFASWQRRTLQGDRLEAGLAWWRRQLAGAPTVLELPTDRPRPPVVTFRGGRVERALPAGLCRSLSALSTRREATEFMVLLGVFSVLLRRYGGQEDILVGTSIDQRDHMKLEGLIGFFVNTLVLRTRPSRPLPFVGLLDQVRLTVLEACEHGDVPFEKLVETLRPERALSRNPLFQVELNLVKLPGAGLDPSGPVAAVRPVERDAALYELMLTLEGRDEALAAVLHYNSDLYDAATVGRLLAHFERLLAGTVEDGERPLGELPLLSDAERHQLLAEWLPAPPPARRPRASLQRLFAAQAALRPRAIAASCGGQSMTYGELDRQANRLAWWLRDHGVGLERRVAVLGERGLDLLATVLGLAKAGAAYVPLEPGNPDLRLAAILADCQPVLLITQADMARRALMLAAGLPEPPQVLCWDEAPVGLGLPDRRDLGVQPDAEPPEGAAPQAMANIFYTSGSTGRPKGAMIEHRGMLNHLWAKVELLGLDAGSVVAQNASPGFDISIWQFLAALLVGGRVVIYDDAAVKDAGSFLARVERDGVTVLETVPTLLDLMLAGVAPAVSLPRLACLMSTGEMLQVPLCRRWHERFPHVPLINAYGPTECSDDVAHGVFRTPPAADAQRAAVGRAIPGMAIFVLDRGLAPVPLGIPGQIAVQGTGVGRGYLQDPVRTARAFVPSPFAVSPGERLYLTGDLGRFTPEGVLEYLGRIDHQIKLRGLRVELGEIEEALGRHPNVCECVVVLRRDGPGESRLVAYIVGERGAAPAAGELRGFLRERLPEHMVPSAFVTLSALPLTPAGKVDRSALPAPRRSLHGEEGHEAPTTELQRAIAAVWCEVLEVDRVGNRDNFFDLGGHSLLLMRVHGKLIRRLDVELSPIDLFRYPTVSALARHLAKEKDEPIGAPSAVAVRPAAGDEPVAIVGMAARLPGARDLEELWRNLRDGVESVTFLSDEELLAAGVDPELLSHPLYIKARAVLDGVDLFDAAFFDYHPGEAELMDPQHRLFLECAWEALERAGYLSDREDLQIGVYAGTNVSTYALFNIFSNREIVNSGDALQVLLNNDKDFLATRVSYKLNLKGPSVTVQTASSTGLVAVHMAARSLLGGECEMALAGSTSIFPRTGYLYVEGGLSSADGHCRAFDERGSGAVGGDGVGVVVLKRLSRALADGDSILAVIRGTSINNDGSSKVSFTAPSVEGQTHVILEALTRAGVKPETIGYVEAHGTGTALGDPIEVAALTQAFRTSTDRKGFCALGSVKTNLGHLNAAAGMAGLIKTVLCLQHRQIPPSLHFEDPNPQIEFAASPFFVNTRLLDWKAEGAPRLAGVSSFALGGTNAHAVLEEAPPLPPSEPSQRRWQLLILSARTESALEAATDRLADHLEEHPETDLADLAYTLQVGRRSFEHRRMLVCDSLEDAVRCLRSRDFRRLLGSVHETADRPVTFLFPGVGDQYPGLGLELYRTEPVFRETVDYCAERLRPLLGLDLRDVIYPPGPQAPGESGAAGTGPDLRRMLERRAGQAEAPSHCHPAVFVVELALARLLMAWGIRPQSLIGHSLGEYVAATVAGVFSLEDALMLVARRAQMIEELPAGAMLALPLPPGEVGPFLRDGVCLAAVNAPDVSVLAGPPPAISDLEGRLAAEGVVSRRLAVSHAFHSALMEPIAKAFQDLVARLRLSPPIIPFISNVTGTWIRPEEAVDPEYWVRHLCRTVRFAEGLRLLGEEPGRILVELGPSLGLGSLALADSRSGGRAVISALRRAYESGEDLSILLTALGRLWLEGVPLDGERLHALERRRRLPLPTYPFERRRYWIEARRERPVPQVEVATSGLKSEPYVRKSTASHPRPALKTPYVAPRSDQESRMAELWQEMLSFEQVGIHDNFFDLGGHSLLGARLLARVRDRLGIDLPVRVLFEGPTVEQLAARAELAGPAPDGEAIRLEPVPRDGELPLSFVQQRFWFLHRLEPFSPAYNLSGAVRLQGRLSPRRLAEAVEILLQRHEILRTRFPERNGGPVQMIEPQIPFQLPLVDLRALREDEREAVAREVVVLECLKPLDLEMGPLFQMIACILGEEDHVLVLVMHHILSDGWSTGIFIDELGMAYGALARGERNPLPDLPLQYVDFAAWERRWLSGDMLDRQLRFWREHLAGASSLALPLDHPRPPLLTSRGAAVRLLLPQSLRQSLAEVGRRNDASSFMTLLAALVALLIRHSGVEDLVIGTPVANRARPELERMIGCFANNLALRLRVAGDPDFASLLAAVRGVALDAYAHQDLPFSKLVEDLQPARDLSRNPVFQVMLNLLNQPSGSSDFAGLWLSRFPVDVGVAQLDLSLSITEAEQGLECVWDYSVDLFDHTTVQRLSANFQVLLEGIVAEPLASLFRLPLMSEPERHQMLLEWNTTVTPSLRGRCIHHLFEEQARRRPETLAILDAGQGTTYLDLDRRAERLALRLRALGVGPEVIVGVLLERSAGAVAALLGILKAGGAYLPLDPSHPQERQAFVLADAGCPLVVTEAAVLPHLPLHHRRGVVTLEDLLAEEADSGDPGPARVQPDYLAYVMYTSGSTGRPKGVQVRHGSVVSFLASMLERPGMIAGDRLLALTTFTFDISILEVFLPLAAGACIVLGDRDLATSPMRLRSLLVSSGVTVVQATPAHWRLWLAEGSLGTADLTALCGGEAMPADLASELAGKCRNLWNLYGPTETTVWSALHAVANDLAGRTVPLGRPIANTRLHVLDPGMRTMPLGVPGELCIGGDGVARGYLGRPDLTAERFIPDPCTGSGERLYRTGDLARYRPDGALEFLGRTDHQVKIRGFRIEPGEVEAALCRHAGVRECVVIVRGSEADPSLCAYFVAADGAQPGANELRRHLAELLPAYMIPSLYIRLDSLPLSSNGKVDRRALPAPEKVVGAGEAGSSVPRTAVEEVVAGIWEEVLKIAPVGRLDHFFAIGGHSLLATRVVSRIRESFAVDVPLRRLFEEPTVAGLARIIDAALRGREGVLPTAPIERLAQRSDLPLSFAQQRLWFLEQLDPGSSAYAQSGAVSLLGRLEVKVLAACFTEVVRRHEALRACFREVEGRPVQEIGEAEAVALPVADLSDLPRHDQREQLRQLMLAEERRPFGLGRGPLLRLLLTRLGAGEHVLIFAMHHIVSDAWSMQVLLGELQALYPALAAERPSPLPELPVQYADFAAWQRQWLAGEVLESHLAYWRRRLAGCSRPLLLPADGPRPAVDPRRGAHQRFHLAAELTAGLRELSRREGVTLFMTLLAGFKAVLRGWSDCDDVVVGADIANRTRGEVEGLIGFFVNMLVLRTDLSRNPSFRQLLAQVREVALGAYAHQDLPFDRLVEELQPGRNAGHSPLFSVVFNFNNTQEAGRMTGLGRLGDLLLEPVEVEQTEVRFELALQMRETAAGLEALWLYSRELFADSTIERMHGGLEAVLETAVEDPEARLSRLVSAGEPDRRRLEAREREAGRRQKLWQAKPIPVRMQQDHGGAVH